MRLVLQRVRRARVTWDSGKSEIGPGVVVLVGVGPADDAATVDRAADRITHLRIFEDAEGKTNLSLLDVGGAALVISQFTLYADVSRGRRPGFSGAAAPGLAEGIYGDLIVALQRRQVPVATGSFGAEMEVELVNQGPFTLVMDTDTLSR